MHGNLLRFRFQPTYWMECALEHVMMHALEERRVELLKLFESLGGGARNVML
jgi:hypothetical protein